MEKYGHVGVITGVKFVLSSCCKAKPISIQDGEEVNGLTPIIYVCSKCKTPYEAMTIDIIN